MTVKVVEFVCMSYTVGLWFHTLNLISLYDVVLVPCRSLTSTHATNTTTILYVSLTLLRRRSWSLWLVDHFAVKLCTNCCMRCFIDILTIGPVPYVINVSSTWIKVLTVFCCYLCRSIWLRRFATRWQPTCHQSIYKTSDQHFQRQNVEFGFVTLHSMAYPYVTFGEAWMWQMMHAKLANVRWPN